MSRAERRAVSIERRAPKEIMMKHTITALALVLAVAASAAAQPTVFLVRHAERADEGMMSGGMTSDPDLSAAGRERAAHLAQTLRDVDLTAAFATEFKRTRQTAAPSADSHHLQVTTVRADDTTGLLARIRRARGSVLVVAHSDTIGDILKGLGVRDIPEIADTEYDNLFIVPVRATRAIRLHY
jgi:broad specificity phosphatase PhoE